MGEAQGNQGRPPLTGEADSALLPSSEMQSGADSPRGRIVRGCLPCYSVESLNKIFRLVFPFSALFRSSSTSAQGEAPFTPASPRE